MTPGLFRYEAIALAGVPEIQAGDDLAAAIAGALAASALELAPGDVLVVAQKIVSKAEGRRVRLADVRPTARADALAARVRKDPRLVELILSESVRVVRAVPNVLIVEHRLGFVHANAGIDQSNVAGDDGAEAALLLPLDPDASAARLRAGLAARTGSAPAVVINDSFGRPWRRGTVGVAIGAAGLPSWADLRGLPDRHGRALQSSELGHADEIAAAGSLLMGQAAEGRPVVLLRGVVSPARPALPAKAMLRPAAEDLFR
ncbi:MAG: coenzyme F420-0:L-glutamate ligase [Lautropia sp.]